MNIGLLKVLSEAPSVSGREDVVRDIVVQELASLGEVSMDSMGNVLCRRAGKPGAKKVMIAAHMDEIGFVVKHIDSNGFLRIHTLGGWDPRMMNAQRVVVQTSEGILKGLLMAAVKPAHLLTDGDKGQQKTDDFFVDLGLTGDEVKSKVKIGDSVTMDRTFEPVGNLLTGKAMDDRVGLFVMIEALRELKEHEVEVVAVATVQEEIGLRGAAAAGWSVQPDIAIALDITLALDVPGGVEHERVTELGKGTAIKVMDSSLICHPKLVEHFRQVAIKHEIKHQMELLTRGGTDSGAVQRLHGGIPSFTLSIPTRYVHTVNETVHADDVQASIQLLARYLEVAHEGVYSY